MEVISMKKVISITGKMSEDNEAVYDRVTDITCDVFNNEYEVIRFELSFWRGPNESLYSFIPNHDNISLSVRDESLDIEVHTYQEYGCLNQSPVSIADYQKIPENFRKEYLASLLISACQEIYAREDVYQTLMDSDFPFVTFFGAEAVMEFINEWDSYIMSSRTL